MKKLTSIENKHKERKIGQHIDIAIYEYPSAATRPTNEIVEIV